MLHFDLPFDVEDRQSVGSAFKVLNSKTGVLFFGLNTTGSNLASGIGKS